MNNKQVLLIGGPAAGHVIDSRKIHHKTYEVPYFDDADIESIHDYLDNCFERQIAYKVGCYNLELFKCGSICDAPIYGFLIWQDITIDEAMLEMASAYREKHGE